MRTYKECPTITDLFLRFGDFAEGIKEGFVSLYYDVENNYFVDDYNTPIYNIFDFLTPSELMMFKLLKESFMKDIIFDNNGDENLIVEFVYPETEKEN